jgi:hypothetical protein
MPHATREVAHARHQIDEIAIDKNEEDGREDNGPGHLRSIATGVVDSEKHVSRDG